MLITDCSGNLKFEGRKDAETAQPLYRLKSAKKEDKLKEHSAEQKEWKEKKEKKKRRKREVIFMSRQKIEDVGGKDRKKWVFIHWEEIEKRGPPLRS